MCQGRLNHSHTIFTIRLTLLLASMLIFAQPLLAQTQDPETPYTAVVIHDNTPLRAGAAKTFYVVGKLPAGTLVRVEEVFHGWYRIASPKNVFSYISKAHVDARGDGSQGQVNSDRAPVNAASINGVGESYRRQLNLSKGQTVRIVGEESGFYKIVTPPKAFVFIAPDALKKSLPEQQPPNRNPQPAPTSNTNQPQPKPTATKPPTPPQEHAVTPAVKPALQSTPPKATPQTSASPPTTNPPSSKIAATNTQQSTPHSILPPKLAAKPVLTTKQSPKAQPTPKIKPAKPAYTTPKASIQKKTPNPAQSAPPTSSKEPAVEVQIETPPPTPRPTVRINIREPAKPQAAANTTRVSPPHPSKSALLQKPIKPAPQPTAPDNNFSDTNQTTDQQTTDDGNTPNLPAPNPQTFSDSKPTSKAILDQQSITPKQKIKPQNLTLAQTEARFKAAFQLPLEEQPLSQLLTLYTNLSTNAHLQPSQKQIIQTRIALINRNIKLAQAVADLKRVKQEVGSSEIAAYAADNTRSSNPLGNSTSYKYNAIGLLLTSRVYDGSSLPKLYRVVDPQGQRTIAYVQPASSSLKLTKFLGKIVGIKGASRFDSSLTLNILDAQQIDVLEPSIAKPAQ